MMRVFPASPAPVRVEEAGLDWPAVSADAGRQLVRHTRPRQAYPVRRLRLAYEGITLTEVAKFRTFFELVRGRTGMFHFIDPATGAPFHARFDQDRMGWSQTAAFDYRTAFILEEVPIAWAPTHLDACGAWFDAGRITGLVDGDSVAQWNDLSGNGRHLAQATASKRPTWETGEINNRPVVRADGTDDVLASAAFASVLSQPNTVLLVAKLASGAGWFVDGLTSGRHIIAPLGSAWRINAGADLVSATVPDSSYHVFVAVFDWFDSILRLDGAQIAAGDASNDNLAGITLFADKDGANFVHGHIAELAVWNQRLIPDELRLIEHHAAAKYGLTIA